MHASSDIVLCDGYDQTQVGGNELVFSGTAIGDEIFCFSNGAFIPFFLDAWQIFFRFFASRNPFGEFSLFFSGQKIDFSDFFEVHLDGVIDFDFARLNFGEFVNVCDFLFLAFVDVVIQFVVFLAFQ